MKVVLSSLLVFSLAWSAPLAGVAATQPAATPAPQSVAPIRTRAELDAYLRSIPPDRSPLALLPSGARKRFLGTLVWGRKGGVGGFNYADLQQYLTVSQIHRVLALFDLQAYDIDGRATSLTAAERAAPETPLERKFDRLYFANRGKTPGKADVSLVAIYAAALAPYQSPKAIAALDASDVHLLLRAAEMVAFWTPASRYLDDMRLDLEALHQRGLATPAQASSVHDKLAAARRFADANALARRYPAAHIPPLPPSQQAPNFHNGDPTVLVMEPDARYMLHKSIDTHVPLLIVVVAGCHFSVAAVRAVRADPQLDALFRKHAIWLADQNESLPDVLAWNRAYPDQPMNVAWRDDQWHALNSWAIPTYYVFRDGKLTDQWSGWFGAHDLKHHLAKAGLLH